MIQIPKQSNVELMNEKVAELAINIAGGLHKDSEPKKLEALANLVKAVNCRRRPVAIYTGPYIHGKDDEN